MNPCLLHWMFIPALQSTSKNLCKNSTCSKMILYIYTYMMIIEIVFTHWPIKLFEQHNSKRYPFFKPCEKKFKNPKSLSLHSPSSIPRPVGFLLRMPSWLAGIATSRPEAKAVAAMSPQRQNPRWAMSPPQPTPSSSQKPRNEHPWQDLGFIHVQTLERSFRLFWMKHVHDNDTNWYFINHKDAYVHVILNAIYMIRMITRHDHVVQYCKNPTNKTNIQLLSIR